MKIRSRRKKMRNQDKPEAVSFFKERNSMAVPSGNSFFNVQTKLDISKAGDPMEKQADTVADRVVNQNSVQRQDTEEKTQAKLQRQAAEEDKTQAKMQRQPAEEDKTQAKLQRQAAGEDKTQAKLQREEKEEMQTKTEISKKEEEEKAQTKPLLQRKEGQPAKNFETRMKEAKTGGSPLPDVFREEMEHKFGYPFGHVRIHTDETAAAMCEEINAQAFTNGCHIFFNRGKYNPGSATGKHLLVHELTHVVQQESSWGNWQWPGED